MMEVPSLAGKDLLAAAKCCTLHNGVKIPFLGLGTWKLKGDRLRSGLYAALSENYGLIDTAAVYENEEEISMLLKQAGNPRVFITSKLQPKDAVGRESTLRAFKETTERLGVDQLDLYLIHWPGTSRVPADSDSNRRMRLECWQAMEELYEQKKVRAIGVSNFLVRHIEKLMADGAKIMPMVNQLEWHPMCWMPEMISFAKENKIILQAYSSLGSGDNRLLVHPVVKEIAAEIKQPESVVLLRFCVEQGLLIIPCSTSRVHLKENAAALDVQLTKEQMNKLCSIQEKDKHRFCWDPNVFP